MKKSINYLSYLLRLWRDSDAAPWRASLEDPHTSERRSFADAAKLLAFLREQMQPETIHAEHDAPPQDQTGGHT